MIPISTAGRIVHWDAEWHWDATYSQYTNQALGGHILALGLTNAYQIWQEYTYPIFDWAHRQGGIAGFAHMQYLSGDFPQDLNCCIPIEYPVEVALGACDFISEDVNGDDIFINAYYRLLNCGFRPGFAAGSDYPCNSSMGHLLTYVRIPDGQLTYSNWIGGIAKGRTAVSRNWRNEFLDFKVNGSAMPGDEIQLPGGESVQVDIQWMASQNLAGTIELVQNGIVVASKSASAAPGAPDSLRATVDFTRSGWLCARRMSNYGHEFHTAAVFVTVDHAPIRTSAADAQFYVQWMDNLMQKTSPGGEWNHFFSNSLNAAQARYSAAKSRYEQIALDAEAAALQSVTITTTSLPSRVVNTAYTARLTAISGTLPYTWSLAGGSLPPGLTLSTNGVITGTPTAAGFFSFTGRVSDAGSPLQITNKALSITIATVPVVTIWSNTTVPGLVDGGPDRAAELGVKFQSDVAGTITGIRFYKATANTGAHVGNLWTSTGTPLATATFSNETASGWQQAFFVTPVAIASNTVYVASYHANSGHYSADLNYFLAKGVDNPPLHALTNGVSGGNGVFAYGASSVFPNQTWNAANYWVDVVFQAEPPRPPPTLTSIAVTPANPSIITGASQQFTATGTYSDGSTQNVTSQATWISSNTLAATINAGGLAAALSAGTTTISAALAGVTNSTALTVLSAPLAITTTSLANGVVNVAYTGALTANGGTLPYTWSISSGSLPPGLTLTPSSGVITGTPSATGSVSFTAQVMDAGNPAQTATKSLSITIVFLPAVVTIWSNTTVPGLVDGGPDRAAELGVKFQSDVAGTITGIRFYKATANTGAHVGNLWTSTGTPLATATFSNETASGWQQAFFVTPVAIASNTVYVASYHANSGHYSADDSYFLNKGVDNPPLHALTNGVSGGNGVYAYGASSVFPNQTWNAANYWVDVVFQAEPPRPPPTLTSIAVTPANPSIITGASQQFTATGTYSDGSTQNVTSQATWISSNTLAATINAGGLAAALSAGTTTISAALAGVTNSTALTVLSAPLAITTTSLANGVVNVAYTGALTANGGTLPYTWSISSGSLPPGLTLTPSSGVITGTPSATGSVSFTAQVMDAGNPAQTATKSLSITIVIPAPVPEMVTIWPSTIVPEVVDGGPDSAVELGVKFQSDVAGTITGIRFYKATANTGTHVGNLWTSTGTPLATATFSNETASGWQQALFDTPVAIASNTVYVASYHANSGHYSADDSYFLNKGVDNPPLHALTNGVSGGNGVYAYGASSVFPNQTWNAANYWVDVVFEAGRPPPTLTSIAVTPANPSIITGASQQFTATGTYSDGSTQNITSQATWISSNTLAATINAGGLAAALSVGTTTISAALAGVTNSTALTVLYAPLAVTTTSLTNGVVNVAYTATLTASGGTLPYTWSLAGGSLPEGLTLNPASGAITGMPTTTGSVSFIAQVSDVSQQTETRQLSIIIMPMPSVTIWPSTTVPGLADWGPDSAVEVGIKFKSDVYGTITGIRFYKAMANTGTHVGNLWSSTGVRLAMAIFTNETLSGWQQILFATPVAITPHTIYVASYHANNGHYSEDVGYFLGNGVDNPPLHALANGVAGGNGVYAYGASSTFPTRADNAANYWVDVMFDAGIPPTLTSITVTPVNTSILAGISQQFTAIGTYSDGSMQNVTSQATWISSNTGVATINAGGLALGISAGATTITAALVGVTGDSLLTVQSSPLAIGTTYMSNGVVNVDYTITLTASGGTLPYLWSVEDGALPLGLTLNPDSGTIAGTPSTTGTFNFIAQVSDAGNPAQTVTKPFSITITTASFDTILVLTNAANPFSQYYAEILLTEGLNEFELKDISSVSSAILAQYDVIILGEVALTPTQVSLVSNWVNEGGHLIAMRPDKQLSGLLGLTDTGSTITNGYLLVNTSAGPGVGIVGQTIQFHGTADCYTLGDASSLATLYSNAQTSTINPAVTLRSVGTNGGQAAAFTFDLARSIVYTRQGNPAWAGQDRDGNPPIRSDDLFYGAATNDLQPDWIDWNKVAIPQADEQQRLLANMIITMASDKNLLPRFWYFPDGYKAVVVMTGDDHALGQNGMVSRFDQYMALSPTNGSVDDWTAIRSTSYIFPNSSLTDIQAAAYDAAGFEIGLHLNTVCGDYTRESLDAFLFLQLNQFRIMYPSLPSPTTLRIHCIAWSDYTTTPEMELLYGIRLDVSYYYYPSNWVADRPGFFTGSGMPMRFATAEGNVIDVYQAATEMTDESGQSYPYTVDFLLDRALGPEGYYGAFVMNAHTDVPTSPESDAIVSSAIARGVPVISARQLLTWVDARNASSFKSINWNNGCQTFSVNADTKAKGLQAMLPVPGGSRVSVVKCNGSPIAYDSIWIKGIVYSTFPACSGDYEISYEPDTTPPSVTEVLPSAGASGVNQNTEVFVTFNEAMNAATINTNTITLCDSLHSQVSVTVSYDASVFTAVLTPASSLVPLTTYTVTVKGNTGGVTDVVGNPLTSDVSWLFNTVDTFNIWPDTTLPEIVDSGPDSAVELGVKFRSEVDGTITGIRFYKADANTGTHVGNLWSSNGTRLATVTFTNETASGWQQVFFATPVAIASNTVYVASYHANSGHYSADLNYFQRKGMDNLPLHALANGVSGGNGVFVYGASSAFPNQDWYAANYWVDVVFKANAP